MTLLYLHSQQMITTLY